MNYCNPPKTNFKINKIELEDQEEAPSKFKIISVVFYPVVTVGTVLKERKCNEHTSIHCFINVEDRPTRPTAHDTKSKLSKKR